MPTRPTQLRANHDRGRLRAKRERTHGGVFHMTQEKVRVAPDMVAGMLRFNSLSVYTLIDPKATHSFVARKIMGELGVNLVKQKREFIISTFLGETLDIDHVYKKLGVSIGVYKMKVNNTFRIT
jgi:hypothetical protein